MSEKQQHEKRHMQTNTCNWNEFYSKRQTLNECCLQNGGFNFPSIWFCQRHKIKIKNKNKYLSICKCTHLTKYFVAFSSFCFFLHCFFKYFCSCDSPLSYWVLWLLHGAECVSLVVQIKMEFKRLLEQVACANG